MLKVTQERIKQGLSQCKLAQLAGINPTSLSRIESKKEPAFTKRGERIAAALGWEGNAEELFEEVEEWNA